MMSGSVFETPAVPGLSAGLSSDGRLLALRCRPGTTAAAAAVGGALADGSAALLKGAAGSPRLILMTAGLPLYGAGPASDGAACALRREAARAAGTDDASVLVLSQGPARELVPVAGLTARMKEALADVRAPGRLPPPWIGFAAPFMTPDGRFTAAGCGTGNPAEPLSNRTTVLMTDLPASDGVLARLAEPLQTAFFGWLEAAGTALPADALTVLSTGTASEKPVLSRADPRAEALRAGLSLALERVSAGMAKTAGMTARIRISGALSHEEAGRFMRPLFLAARRLRSCPASEAAPHLWAALAAGGPEDLDWQRVTAESGGVRLLENGRFAAASVLAGVLRGVLEGRAGLEIRLSRGSASTFLWA